MWRGLFFLSGMMLSLTVALPMAAGAYVYDDDVQPYIIIMRDNATATRQDVVQIDPTTGDAWVLMSIDITEETISFDNMMDSGSQPRQYIDSMWLAPHRRGAMLKVIGVGDDYYYSVVSLYYLDFDRHTSVHVETWDNIRPREMPQYALWSPRGDGAAMLLNLNPINGYHPEVFWFDVASGTLQQITNLGGTEIYGWIDDENILVWYYNNGNYTENTVNVHTGKNEESEDAVIEGVYYNAQPLDDGSQRDLRDPSMPTPPPPAPGGPNANPYQDGSTIFTPDGQYAVDLVMREDFTGFTAASADNQTVVSVSQNSAMTIMGWLDGDGYRLLMYRTTSKYPRGFIYIFDIEAGTLLLVADVSRNSAAFEVEGCVYRWEQIIDPRATIPCRAEISTADDSTQGPDRVYTSEVAYPFNDGEVAEREWLAGGTGPRHYDVVYREDGDEQLLGDYSELLAIADGGQQETPTRALILSVALAALGATRLLRKPPRWW